MILFTKKILITFILLLPTLLFVGCDEIESYDVIVIGSDPEGIAAAVSSARNGNETLLIDTRDQVGGLFTLGKLNTIDMNYDPDQKLLTRGIFQEVFNQLEGHSFDVQTAQTVLEEMINSQGNLTYKLGNQEIAPILKEDTVAGIRFFNADEEKQYYAGKVFIDATQNADFAYQAGVDFTYGQEDFGGPKTGQIVTLVFELAGVNWDTLMEVLNDPNTPSSHSGATKDSAWGFLEEMRSYEGIDPLIRTRGPNLGRQNNGNVLVNAMHIFGVDGLDPASVREGIERGTTEAENIVKHMRHELPGFENAELVGVAEELYIRETRHMKGLYRLTIDDVLEHRDFWDKIALGSYPVDIQPTSMENWGSVVGNPAAYSIPFRSIVPKNIENLLVVGRSASYDSLAHGSARVVPIGMGTGEAAGVAAKLTIDNNITMQELAESSSLMEELQNTLRAQGAYLPEELNYPVPIVEHPAYDAIKLLRGHGLIMGRYTNDYQLEKIISEEEFIKLSQLVYDILEGNEIEVQNLPVGNIALTGIQAESILQQLFQEDYSVDCQVKLTPFQ